MRPLKHINFVYFLGILLIFSGCEIVKNENSLEVPEPEIVNAQDLPDYLHNSEEVYFLVHNNENAKKWERGAKPILEELLDNELYPKNAWFPLGITPCMVPNAFEAFIVLLDNPNQKILEFGFIAKTDSLVLNCGIQEFEHYNFK